MFKDEDLKTIKTVFERIRRLHPYWVGADDGGKLRLEKNLEKDFEKLERLGVHRSFPESILFWGKEFVDSLGGPTVVQKAEVVFKKQARDRLSEEERAFEMAQKNNIQFYEIVKERKGGH